MLQNIFKLRTHEALNCSAFGKQRNKCKELTASLQHANNDPEFLQLEKYRIYPSAINTIEYIEVING